MGRSIARISIFAGTFLLFFVATILWAKNVTTFDDIDFWIGQGKHQAALVIDWDDANAADTALVWGYRWDGMATGEDMLLDIVESDPRLFVRLSAPSTAGIVLFGLGYDLNDNAEFGTTGDTVFDTCGIAITGLPNDDKEDTTNFSPAATSVDPADLYAEGWFSGFWHYGNSDRAQGNGNPFDGGSWAPNATSLSDRLLSAGDWDSWAFTFNTDPPHTAFAENPVATDASLLADFDSDADVDGADFLIWQRGFGRSGNASLEQGDANCDQHVDQLDLQLWAVSFGSGATGGALQSTLLGVPEPPCIACAMWFFVLFYSRVFFNK